MSLISAITSLTSSDALAKLEIDLLASDKVRMGQKLKDTWGELPIKALFNPSQLRFSKEVSWEFAPVAGRPPKEGYHRLSFRESKPTTLAIELFFDTYEGVPKTSGGGLLDSIKDSAMSALTALNPLPPDVSAEDVTKFTKKVKALANIDKELHRPPRCQLRWGAFTLIEGVLTSLTEDYTLFLPNGMPVRATLTCSFTEVIDASSSAAYVEPHSADIAKRWVVKQGETLSGIAQSCYNDATRWRLIAEANRIEDPRRVPPGCVLTIPPLPDRGAR